MTTAPVRSRRSEPSSVAQAPRLPWWAAALPVLAFALLLSLLLGGTEASAAQQHAESAGAEVIAAVLERVAQALLG